MRILTAILILSTPLAGWAQCNVVPQQPQPVSIEARVTEYTPPEVHAEGCVLFQQGQKRLRADTLDYNLLENTGFLTNATFTTCDLAHPEYRISARRITLTPDQHLRAERVRLYLGNFRFLSLPKLSMNIGPGGGQQTLIPRPGYSKHDGLFLNMNIPLVQSDKVDASALIRPTTHAGIQGGIVGGYALSGSTSVAPPYVPESNLELRSQRILTPRFENGVCVFPQAKPHAPVLEAFGAILFNERVYNVNNTNLRVTRLPEVGLRYVSPVECLPGEDAFPVGVQLDSRISWGRFEETPDGGFNDRFDARGIASTTLASLGHGTALRGSGSLRYSSYSTSNTYKVVGAALDASRVYPTGSFASIRLIGHASSGSSPFQFDTVDIKEELQGAGKYVRGRNTFGLLLRYDLTEMELRDWEVSYARRLHCLEPSVSWRPKFSQISFNVRVLGF